MRLVYLEVIFLPEDRIRFSRLDIHDPPDTLRPVLKYGAKSHENVYLMYTNPDGVQGDDVVLITLKTIRKNLADIHEFILKNHSWGTPCIEVVPIISDMC